MTRTVTRPFRGVSASERQRNRRQRLVDAAFDLAGTHGAASLGVGDVCTAAGLTKRYFYESFGSIDDLGAAAPASPPSSTPFSTITASPAS
jgi:AcrR family transcriptional regulator